VYDNALRTCRFLVESFSEKEDGVANAVGDTAVRSALTRGQLCGKTVIELGAGCGILGVTAAALGASNVFVTDLPECLELINNTVSDSQLGASTTAAVLDWNEPRTFLTQYKLEGTEIDLILGADIVFSVEFHEALVNTVDVLSSEKTVFLLG